MKGIVFTDFFELVEEKFGIDTVDVIIEECELSTGGVYTSVGTYSHKDIFIMVNKLSEIKKIEVRQLLKLFGQYFFSTLKVNYPQFLNQECVFDFLSSIDSYIHPEVLKLYPDAELPSFIFNRIKDDEVSLNYSSSRKLSDFAVGLIYGAAEFFNDKVEVEKIILKLDGTEVLINIKKVG